MKGQSICTEPIFIFDGETFLIGNNWFSQGLGAKISNLTKSSSFITFFVGQKLPWGYKVLGAIIPPSSLRAPVCRHCSRRLNAAPPPSHGCPLIRNWIPIFPLVCVCVLKAQFGSVVLVKLKAAPPPSLLLLHTIQNCMPVSSLEAEYHQCPSSLRVLSA